MKKILFFLLISQIYFSQQWSIPFSERSALVSLYNSTFGEEWNQPWDLNKDPKFWYGIRIKNGRVTEVNLNGNGLKGQFPPYVSSLQKLAKLDLSSNRLSGELPQTLSFLPELVRLDISHNAFTGDPAQALAALATLEELSLGNNQFVFNDIESFLLNFPQLKVLDLSHTALQAVPQKISTLSSLEVLNLSNNIINQNYNALTSLINLRELNISGNQLTKIPAEISVLTSLKTLDASRNLFASNYSAPLSGLRNLEWLSLASNQITAFPAELPQLKKLVHVNFSDNRIGGGFESLLALKELEQIYLDKNLFSGAFPATLLQLSKLQMISLTHNQLAGALPATLPALTFLDNNRFTKQELKNYLINSLPQAEFTYSPQRYDEPKSIAASLGSSVSLPQALSGEEYRFTWFKNLDQRTPVTAENYYISNVEEEDFAAYTCEAYYFEELPSVLMELSFFREPVTLVKELATAEEKTGLAIYPNPTSDYLHIKTHRTDIEKVFIFDLSGKLIMTEKGTTIDVRHLPAAAYIISVKTADSIRSFKFLKR